MKDQHTTTAPDCGQGCASREQHQGRQRPPVKLVGANGNAYNVLGLCHRAAQRAGWTTEQWTAVRDQMMAGDYDHLLGVAMEHFDVR